MKTRLKFLAQLLSLLICLSNYQIYAQTANLHGKYKYIAGVRMPYTSIEVVESKCSTALFDTLYSFPGPGTFPMGLAWDGQYLWNCDCDSLMIYKLTTTGDVVSYFPIPVNAYTGSDLAWDGNYLWLSDEETALLFKIDPASGSVIEEFHLPSYGQSDPNGWGLTWDGQYLWHSEYYGYPMIYKLNPQNGQVISSFIPPSSLILGIAWVNGSLYGVGIENDLNGGMLYKFEPSTGAVLGSTFWEVPYPLGLDWDGQFFWNSSGSILFGGNARIYKINNTITNIENELIDKSDIFSLHQNYPNPFYSTTTINYNLSSQNNIELVIYNGFGKEVKTLVNTRQLAGNYKIEWDGKDNNGKLMPGGVYIYRLSALDGMVSQEMILLR